MQDSIRDFSAKLKELRRSRNLTLEHLSKLSNLTKSYLSKLERGVSNPSISTVLKLSSAYNVDITEFTGTPEGDNCAHVVEFDEQVPLNFPMGPSGFDKEYLMLVAEKGRKRAMQPFIINPPHEEIHSPRVFPHDGEEFILVLTGSIAVTIGNESYDLKTGGSVYFDSRLQHKLVSTSAELATVLVVVCEQT